jgi:predicted LPLAT superfamily acyltransferase
MSSASAGWTASPELGNRAAMRAIAWLALALGRRGTRWMLYPLALYYLVSAPRARRASRAFLARALGRPARIGDVLRHFLTYAASLHDRIYLLCGRCDDLEISIDGAAGLERILERGRGCILLGSHLGSFEALRALGRRAVRQPINVVMYQGATPKVQEIMDTLAPELTARTIEPGRPETMLRIKECLERGEMVGVLGDRPFGSEKSSSCSFLGRPAIFPQGAFRLALALGVPVVVFFGLYVGGNRYRIVLEELELQHADGKRREATEAGVAAYVRRLERYACEAPYNWFNFYDFWHEGLH